jgi:hypothetical protein
MIDCNITGLEAGLWTEEVGKDINPEIPDGYNVMQVPGAVVLYCCSKKPYAGWLAKHVETLPVQWANIEFSYVLTVDAATQFAQVAETDTKVTDAAGWTYPGDGQFNISKGWLFQVGNPWVDTNVRIPPPRPGIPTRITIAYKLDYTAHTLKVVSVAANGVAQEVNTPLRAATQVGWARSEIVTQFQQCTGAKGGAYSLTFLGCAYRLCQ